MLHTVDLSAYNGDTEPERINRLLRVGCAVRQASPAAWQSLAALHDHKGTLTATWHVPPTPLMSRAVEQAWAEEYEYDCQHTFVR